MQTQTQNILTSVLGEDFKVEIENRDKIIAALENQIETYKKQSDDLNKEVEELEKKKSGLQEEINLAYTNKEEQFKNEKENFEKSQSNSIASLDAREKNLDASELKHEADVREHIGNVSALNREKADLANRKKSIVDTLAESLKMHTELLGDAINALKEPYEEEKAVHEPS